MDPKEAWHGRISQQSSPEPKNRRDRRTNSTVTISASAFSSTDDTIRSGRILKQTEAAPTAETWQSPPTPSPIRLVNIRHKEDGSVIKSTVDKQAFDSLLDPSEPCTAEAKEEAKAVIAALPWWKRQLVDDEYRHQLELLATNFYRDELFTLQYHPEKLSSVQGLERRRRPRQNPPPGQQRRRQLLPHLQNRRNVGDSNTTAGTKAWVHDFKSVDREPEAEENETVVMSQYVIVDPGSFFSIRHPDAIQKASTLGNEQKALLDMMPPALNTLEETGQRVAVESHFASKRRFSVDTSPVEKADMALDILRSSVRVPEWSSFGDTGLEQEVKRHNSLDPPLYTFPPLSQRPPTPVHHKLALPSGKATVEAAQHQIQIADIVLCSKPSIAALPCLLNDASSSAALAATARSPREGSRAGVEQVKGTTVPSRYVAAALACVDGVENLYGLQHAWNLPLPPSGFLRLRPDPRYAMWPDDALSASRIDNRNHRLLEMQNLAIRVNERNRRLVRLHERGYTEVCYSHLSLLSPSPSVSSSSSSFSSDSDGGINGSGKGAEASMTKQQAARHKGTKSTQSHGADGKKQRRGHRRRRRRQAKGTPKLRPIYDGALNINIFLHGSEKTSLPSPKASAQSTAHKTVSPLRFVGCYRQSLMLIHFKIFCRALWEEERLRSGGPLTHVQGGSKKPEPSHITPTPPHLRGVPVIPYPVLQLQSTAPPLMEPQKRHLPDLRRVQACRCWEGLYPTPSPNPSSASYLKWSELHRSLLVRQAVRDVFDHLPHDAEGLLDRGSYVGFVLDVLSVLFPTLLPELHIAVAEEEWVYRGTTDHVNSHTFFEKFFPLPFLVYRDLATVTESEYIEFWGILSLCIFPPVDAENMDYATRMRSPRRPQESSGMSRRTPSTCNSHRMSSSPAFTRASISAGMQYGEYSQHALLVPITGLTKEQQRRLQQRDFRFGKLEYDRRFLIREVMASDDVVRLVPVGHQYAVASDRVRRSLSQVYSDTGDRASLAGDSDCKDGKEQMQKRGSELVATLSGSLHFKKSMQKDGTGDTTISRRAQLEAEAITRRAAREEQLHRCEMEMLLDTSARYQELHHRITSRFATTISGISSTYSSWQLHEDDVFHAPVRPQDVEDNLLDYIDDVPSDVFYGHVSLRERYILHEGYQRERRTLQSLVRTTSGISAEKIPALEATVTPEEQYMAAMKGGGGIAQRTLIHSAEFSATPAPASETATPTPQTFTYSYATGLYPLRFVPQPVNEEQPRLWGNHKAGKDDDEVSYVTRQSGESSRCGSGSSRLRGLGSASSSTMQSAVSRSASQRRLYPRSGNVLSRIASQSSLGSRGSSRRDRPRSNWSTSSQPDTSPRKRKVKSRSMVTSAFYPERLLRRSKKFSALVANAPPRLSNTIGITRLSSGSVLGGPRNIATVSSRSSCATTATPAADQANGMSRNTNDSTAAYALRLRTHEARRQMFHEQLTYRRRTANKTKL